jgi:hypothetical protein
MSSTGISVGLKKGYPVEKRTVAKRPSQNKHVRNNDTLLKLKFIFILRESPREPPW